MWCLNNIVAQCVTGQASLLGRRKKNEDRTSVVELTDDIMMFAIYDGHGGEVSDLNWLSIST